MGAHRRRIVALVISMFAVIACGGKAVAPDIDGGSSSGEGGTGSRACSPLPGCTSTTRCPAADGCNTCTCSDGAWACTELGCTAPACPDFGPTSGSACPLEGQQCQSPGRCGSQCTCTKGVWKCVIPPCPPPVCPPTPPPKASSCIGLGLDSCDYGSGCAAIHCYCGKTPEDSGWNCSPVGCDAGVVD
jgi:hypothetical protein